MIVTGYRQVAPNVYIRQSDGKRFTAIGALMNCMEVRDRETHRRSRLIEERRERGSLD